VHAFSDPDDFAASIRATAYELTVTARGQFAGERTRIDLHRLWLQRFRANLPFVAHSAPMRGRAIVTFRTTPGPAMLVDGAVVPPNALVRLGEGQDTFQRVDGAICWGAMSLPVEAMAALSPALADREVTSPAHAQIAPAEAALARLRRLHAAAGDLACTAPEIIANPHAARGLEEALIEAMMGCIAAPEAGQDRPAGRRHAAIMRRFHEAVATGGDSAMYLSELCSAIGVADRTLRSCCQEHLGMSPWRYLWLRRMQLTRRALSRAAPGSATVTAIATGHGFWELGRFAVAYRRLYGESPSVTLAREGPTHGFVPAGRIRIGM
jgi:AraC-like DNA-binding protein